MINPDVPPAALLTQLANAWPNRRPVTFVHALYAAQTEGGPAGLPGIIEVSIAEDLARALANEDRQLLTTTGPIWTRYPATAGTYVELVTTPPLKKQPQELPWAPDDPATGHDVLICRISGMSIPTLLEEVPA